MSLTDAELAGMRATIEAHLPDTAVITRSQPVPDGMGSVSTAGAWAVVATVKCRLSPFAMGESTEGVREAANVLGGGSSWTCVLPNGTDVRLDDRVAINGTTFEVAQIDGVRSWSLDHHVRLRRYL